VVVLNRFAASNELHEANRQWLVERDGFSVVVVPGDEARCRVRYESNAFVGGP